MTKERVVSGSAGEGAAEPAAEGENELRPSGVHRTRSRSVKPPLDSGDPGKQQRAGWTVVDEFERDGYRYQVVRRPAHDLAAGPKLTRREEQVLDYVCEGHSNKSIAYALGLSPSTVGVLVFRAAAKLGVKSRLELLKAYLRVKDGSG